jgi:SAM-dependent methyltransferase
MREFWEARAMEDPFYFVHDGMRYGDPDVEAFWASGEEALDNLLTYLGAQIRETDVVVEIGCGVGRMTRPMARRAGRVIAIDVSQRMLDLAREHNPGLTNVDWTLGDGRTLAAVADMSADACISNVVFQHLPDQRITMGYVGEMGRVLRRGGWAGFQVSNDPAVHRPSVPRRGRVKAWLRGAPRATAEAAWLGSATDLEELRAVAEGSELDLVRVIGEGTQYCGILLRRR